MHRVEPISPQDVRVAVGKAIPEDVVQYARDKVARVTRRVRNRVLYAKVRLTTHRDPAVARPVVAQATLDISGRIVRAQVEAPTAREAVDLLETRLAHRLERIAQHWEARRGRMSTPVAHEWRHDTPRTSRPTYFPRPAGEREIIRHKSYTLSRIGIDEAAFEMDMMDYDFHLFTEAGSEQDSVLHRTDPTGYRLAQVNPAPREHLTPFTVSLTISDQDAPVLSTTEAIDRLDLSGQPFVFFLDAEHARAGVLYRRYDGHYGLITPAE
ncbi:HPF/RaiA family ribosome-associated protein [Kutzneria viridogrisea]|uniref:sigma 54 modulation/S30EA ribosomal C-terminal domain-containing protein n=1 Tax=Kutzneria viridogrisea TaxID=47990 RepID=UPI00160399A7